MTENIQEESRLGDLVEIQKQSLKEIKALRNKKKDIWDIFSTLSTFLSAVVIAALGLYFTNVYNERASAREHQTKVYQTRILEMQTVEKFIPHLTGDEERKKVALLALTSLGSPEFAARFAKLSPSEGTESAADVIMASAGSAEQTEIPNPISSIASSTEREGWAYLGHYVATTSGWKTRYFDFEISMDPNKLVGKTLKVRKETGALNVRVGMPNPVGVFSKIIDVLNPGSEATIHEMREWHSSGYMWARITYGT